MRNGEITPEFIQCMKEDKAQADALAAELKITIAWGRGRRGLPGY